jgi:hypothetical protein
VAVCFMTLGAHAQDQDATQLAPDDAPTPAVRPTDDAPADSVPADVVSEVIDEPGEGNDDPNAPASQPLERPIPETLAEPEEELRACLAALTDLGATFVTGDPITEAEDRDCGMVNPVTITQIAAGVDLEPEAILRCDAALAAARWVADAVSPFSQKLGDRGRLVGLDNGTAYLCRPRADGETSEHAFGNALDIMAFRFESGDPIPVQPRGGDGTIEESFQRAVRSAACLDFTTVLGPGSDADHRDHLHLDVKRRENGFRICQ